MRPGRVSAGSSVWYRLVVAKSRRPSRADMQSRELGSSSSVSAVSRVSTHESSIDILHASLGRRRNQRAQGTVVESVLKERDDVHVKTKFSDKAMNDVGLP